MEISNDLQLSSSMAGLLTGLPLISFALASPVAPKIAHPLGQNRGHDQLVTLMSTAVVIPRKAMNRVNADDAL